MQGAHGCLCLHTAWPPLLSLTTCWWSSTHSPQWKPWSNHLQIFLPLLSYLLRPSLKKKKKNILLSYICKCHGLKMRMLPGSQAQGSCSFLGCHALTLCHVRKHLLGPSRGCASCHCTLIGSPHFQCSPRRLSSVQIPWSLSVAVRPTGGGHSEDQQNCCSWEGGERT